MAFRYSAASSSTLCAKVWQSELIFIMVFRVRDQVAIQVILFGAIKSEK